MNKFPFVTDACFIPSTDLDEEFEAFLDSWTGDIVQAPTSVKSNARLPEVPEEQHTSSVPSSHGSILDGIECQHPENGPTRLLDMPRPVVEEPLQATSDQGVCLLPGNRSNLNQPQTERSAGTVERICHSQPSRRARAQECNRLAQRRFRERQKVKMGEVNMQLGQLQKEMDNMSLEKGCLKRQNEALQKLIDLRQQEVEALSDVARIHEESESASRHFAEAKELQEGLEAGVTIAQLRCWRNDEVIAKWACYMRRLQALIERSDAPQASQACLTEMIKVGEMTGCFARAISFVNPLGFKLLCYTNLATGGAPPGPHSQMQAVFGKAVEALELSGEQKNSILVATNKHINKLAHIHSHWDTIAARLVAKLPAIFLNSSQLGAPGSTPEVLEPMEELRRNNELEQRHWIQFGMAVFFRILTPLQFARYCAQVYPLFPDPVRLSANIIKRDFKGYAAVLFGDSSAAAVPPLEEGCTDAPKVAALSIVKWLSHRYKGSLDRLASTGCP